jgi:SAM-dependent methyltransferase
MSADGDAHMRGQNKMINGVSAMENDANAWGLPGVLNYFSVNRRTSSDVYPSEWFFLKDRLKDGISVLDIGCAQGGFADILSEQLSSFSYTGLDVNPEMVKAARARHPSYAFHEVREGDFSVLGEARFDLVLVLGILHVHEGWRDTIVGAWRHTAQTLVFDLRHVDGPTVEDRDRSYLRMNLGHEQDVDVRVPYILVNAAEAQKTVAGTCAGARTLAQYGYRHPVSGFAVTPVDHVMAVTWCAER